MTHPATGEYFNPSTYQYEYWAVNVRTKDERLLTVIGADLPTEARHLLGREVWGDFLRGLGARFDG